MLTWNENYDEIMLPTHVYVRVCVHARVCMLPLGMS